MLVNGYGFSETLSSMNKKLKDIDPGNGFLGGLIAWGVLTRAFSKIVFRNIVIGRDQANASADTLRILPARTLFTLLEAASATQAKIGVIDQWLNFKEPGGLNRYGAACSGSKPAVRRFGLSPPKQRRPGILATRVRGADRCGGGHLRRSAHGARLRNARVKSSR